MNNVMMIVKIARDNRDDNSGKKALAAGALAASTGAALYGAKKLADKARDHKKP